MKTEYRILWIDDDLRYVRGDQRTLKKFLSIRGIELLILEEEVKPRENLLGKRSFLDAINNPDLDMVFIDFRMPVSGSDVIYSIRKDLHHYHLPILFYTSTADPHKSLQDSIIALNKPVRSSDNIIDGIYFCDREHIASKAIKIFTSLLKKESRPQQTRGLLMDRVSIIDANITKSIIGLWHLVPSTERGNVIMHISGRLLSSGTRSHQLSKNFLSMNCDDLETFTKLIIKNRATIGTHVKADTLRLILDLIGGHAGKSKKLSEFYNDNTRQSLNSIRNIYAHTPEEVLENKNIHNDKQCKFIREESRRQLKNLDDIMNSIK